MCISAFAPLGPAAVARSARRAVPRDCRRSVRRVCVVDGRAAARALPEPGGDAHLQVCVCVFGWWGQIVAYQNDGKNYVGHHAFSTTHARTSKLVRLDTQAIFFTML